MENIRHHLSVKDDRAIWSAGVELPKIIEEICGAKGLGGAGLQEADG